MASQLNGSARVTNDVDICYDTAAENLTRLGALLLEWRAYLRDAEPGLPFQADERTRRNAEALTLTTVEGNLDLFTVVPGIGRYDAAAANSRIFDLNGALVPTLTLDALILSKTAMNRPKDREHVVELEALRDMSAQRDGSRGGA
jgi:hypothetical protein